MFNDRGRRTVGALRIYAAPTIKGRFLVGDGSSIAQRHSPRDDPLAHRGCPCLHLRQFLGSRLEVEFADALGSHDLGRRGMVGQHQSAVEVGSLSFCRCHFTSPSFLVARVLVPLPPSSRWNATISSPPFLRPSIRLTCATPGSPENPSLAPPVPRKWACGTPCPPSSLLRRPLNPMPLAYLSSLPIPVGSPG